LSPDLWNFERYQNNGYLPTEIHINHTDNFIVLCTNCHAGFAGSIPAIVILPTNIQFFIDHELRDYESRMNTATEGQEPQKRNIPTAQAYKDAGGTYIAYALMPGYKTSAAKPWGGSPPAMILKASLGVNTPPLQAEGIDTIPHGTRTQVTRLIELWARPPPTRNTAVENEKGRAEKSSESSESHTVLDDDFPRRKRPATESLKRPAKAEKSAKVEKPAKIFPNLDGACDDRHDWALGPNMSANEIIRLYGGFRNCAFAPP